MPKILKFIVNNFLESCIKEKKTFKNNRDTINALYLYFSHFMDQEISKKRNKYDKNKYERMKIEGLRYIESNYKLILTKINILNKK